MDVDWLVGWLVGLLWKVFDLDLLVVFCRLFYGAWHACYRYIVIKGVMMFGIIMHDIVLLMVIGMLASCLIFIMHAWHHGWLSWWLFMKDVWPPTETLYVPGEITPRVAISKAPGALGMQSGRSPHLRIRGRGSLRWRCLHSSRVKYMTRIFYLCGRVWWA